MSQIPQAEAEQRQRQRCFCASDIRMASGTSSTIDNNVCMYVLCVCVCVCKYFAVTYKACSDAYLSWPAAAAAAARQLRHTKGGSDCASNRSTGLSIAITITLRTVQLCDINVRENWTLKL